jgi:hypothetical protein
VFNAGADPMLRDKAGVTPLHATLFQHSRVTYSNMNNLLWCEERQNMGLGHQNQQVVSVIGVLEAYAKVGTFLSLVLLLM